VVEEKISGQDQPVRNSLQKSEILRGDKRFELIVRDGKTLRAGTILCSYKINPSGETTSRPIIQAGFSVPRRIIKKAIDRNRVKRLMRESYRLNKYILAADIRKSGVGLDILFIYRGKSERKQRYLKLEDVQPDIIRCLDQLRERIAGRNK
jgi:ribonuclease P protein component